MTANKALRSFTAIPDATMVTLLATVEDGVKKAKKGGVIQRLELTKKCYRSDIVFGDLYIVPASVCASSEDFPTMLLLANLKHCISPESMTDFTLHRQGSDKLSSDKLKMAKECLFTGADGKEKTLIVFCPSWADDASYISFPYDEETAFYHLRDLVFSAPFNPSLSSVFEQMKAMDPDVGYRIDSIPTQQHVFKTPTLVTGDGPVRFFPDLVKAEVEEEYPKKEKKASRPSFRLTAANKSPEFADEEVEVIRALETQIQKNIGDAGMDTFKVDASVLAGAYKRANHKQAEVETEVQPDQEVKGKNIIMPEDQRVNPNDPSFSHVEPELKQGKLHKFTAVLMEKAGVRVYKDAGIADKGLRSQPDYCEPGSKETISSETVDGPDPKKAAEGDVPGPSTENVSKALRLLDDVQNLGVELESGVNTDELLTQAKGKLTRLHDLQLGEDVMSKVNAIIETMGQKPAGWDWLTQSMADLRTAVEGTVDGEKVDGRTEETLEQKDEAVTSSTDKIAISLLVPGRVLENFYPELLNEVVDHPEPDLANPNVVDPLSAVPRSPEGMLTNPGGVDPMGDSPGTNPGPGGIGGVRSPYMVDGVPMRQEMNLRGPSYQDDFYRRRDDLSPSTLTMAASLNKQAGEAETFQLSKFLKSVVGDFVASMISGYGVSKREFPFSSTPAEFQINLGEVLQVSTGMGANQMAPSETLKAVISKMSDIEIAEALKSAWAQGAIWNDETETSEGFTFEVYARAEKLDPASLTFTLKFVTGVR